MIINKTVLFISYGHTREEAIAPSYLKVYCTLFHYTFARHSHKPFSFPCPWIPGLLGLPPLSGYLLLLSNSAHLLFKKIIRGL
jgi:hypothetical protein